MCAASPTVEPSHTPLDSALMTYASTYASTRSNPSAEYLSIDERVNSGDRPHLIEVNQPLGPSHPTAATPATPLAAKVMFRPELVSGFGSILF
ncbi:MAG: hypothetical protein HC771_11190 [Synechococcales cyanobacterium CRU_2_2]|nr:hypothetical protein [Synechococcales cyanobacterium CRU_2_2]